MVLSEEATESLLRGMQGDAELAALTDVWNRSKAHEWLKYVSRVEADQVLSCREHLAEEIKAATRGKNSLSQGRNFPGTSSKAHHQPNI
jgi:hypothetical protein